MVALIVFKIASVLGFLSTFASAAPHHKKDVCHDFHVTSPDSYFSATAGQCYQVSYDFWGNEPGKRSKISVDLYEYGSDKFIHNLVYKEEAKGIATPWFNLDLGKYHKSGDYYYVVKYGGCKPIKTPHFYIDWNKNSPPSDCDDYNKDY